MKRLLSLLCCLTICAVVTNAACARDYYVSPAGNDTNPGTDARPWQTIARVNDADLEPGDQVLFQGGQTFAGTITLDANDTGSAAAIVRLSSYGNGRATIDSVNGSALVAKGCSNLAVAKLRFLGSGRKTGNTANGVDVREGEGIELDQLDVSGFRGSGLIVTSVHNARITHVYAHDNGGEGITVGPAGSLDLWSEDIYIGYCVAENNPGDPSNLENHSGSGIVVGCVRGCLIEYCEAMNNGWDMPREGNGPVGIWAWSADRVIIQYCVSHDNKSPGSDGGGYDFDGGVTNSILQYNYSYNNVGPGYYLCQYQGASPWKNNVVRYNLSINDGSRRMIGAAIEVSDHGGVAGGMSNLEIYNNTVYSENAAAIGIGSSSIVGLRLRNNILASKSELIRGDWTSARFEGNCYWPLSGAVLARRSRSGATGYFETLTEWAKASGQEMVDGKLVGLWADPMLVGAGTVPTVKPAALAKLTVYRLQPDSPCIGAGLPIENNGGRDFWGSPVPTSANPTIGAFQQR